MIYVSFLRGINVGGNKILKMKDLVDLFSSYGLLQVKSFITSGNILFDSSKSETSLVTEIEKKLKQSLGYEIKILLRSLSQLEEIVKQNPFEGVSEERKKYVTFLSEKPEKLLIDTNYFNKNGIEIVTTSGREIFTVTSLLSNGRYGDLTCIEKVFGKYCTTRNWNTINRILRI